MPLSKGKVEEVREEFDKQLRSSGDIWLPAHRRLYGVPPIISGEAASSWVWRIAANTRLPVRGILTAMDVSVPSFWLDCGAVSLDVDAIANMTMTSADALQQVRWPQLCILAEPEFACWTADPIRQRPIYRYCGQCLKEDAIPYFRQYWRLASSYVCERHGSILRDACWHCQQPVDLSRGLVPERGARHSGPVTLRRCGRCGADLAAAEPQYFPQTILCGVYVLQQELGQLIARTVKFDLKTRLAAVHANCSLHRHTGQVVDMTDSVNVLALLGSMLQPLVAQEVGEFSCEKSAHRLSRWLRRAGFDKGGQRVTLAIGLDGRDLFGKHAGLVGSYVMRCQQVAGGTYWWPNGALFKIDRLNAFKKEDILSGKRWVTTRGPSKVIGPVRSPKGVSNLSEAVSS